MLMKKPELILKSEKYNITSIDFDEKLHQYIFYAISSMALKGATKIEVQDIDLFLKDSVGGALFKNRNGVALLNDITQLVNESSFDSHYDLFKKENLLRDLKSNGIDTSEFYETNPITQEQIKISDKYLELDIKDILETVKLKVLGIESQYLKNDASETINAFEGMEELLEDLKENPDVGLPLQGDLFNTVVAGARRGTFYVRSASSGVGKALPNSTKIPTPSGWREVSEVRVGDYLFDALGKPTKVTGVFPQGKKEVWEVHFKDGRKAKSSPDHLWSYNTRDQKQKSKDERKFFTKTLKDIAAEELMSGLGYRILVPQHCAVEYGEKKLPIPPYVLGLAIGDGSFRQHDSNKSFQFSSETDELPSVIADTMGYTLKKNSEHNYTWYFGSQKQSDSRKKNIWVEDFLRELPELINTTSANKYIPEMYLYGDTEQRLDLLNGLLDSDGAIDERGRVRFFTNSAKLKDNVTELASSLGYFVTVSEDNHKKNINYIIHITGTPELKNKLFKLARKRERMEDWYNNGNRKERNAHNPIVDIVNLGYEEDMTCFMVDNEEHLFLTEGFIVTHNTRMAVADACHLAFPIRYNDKKCKWEHIGYNEKVLIIVTEQTMREVQTMILAYLTSINESKIKRAALLTTTESEILKRAIEILKHYQDNLHIVRMPNPNIQVVKTIIRENVMLHDIEYVFYDYIFVGPSLLQEFQGFNLRNDEALLMFSTALKDLAVENDIFVMSSTQTNAKSDNPIGIRDEAAIAGARSIINKADVGCIMTRVTPEELKQLEGLIEESGILIPNIVTDIYKNRAGEWTQIRIWSYFDAGTMWKKDLFITNSRLEPVQNFSLNPLIYDVPIEEYGEVLERVNS